MKYFFQKNKKIYLIGIGKISNTNKVYPPGIGKISITNKGVQKKNQITLYLLYNGKKNIQNFSNALMV